METLTNADLPELLDVKRNEKLIFVVDDDIKLRKIVSAIVQRKFGRDGYEIRLFDDGHDALENIAASGEAPLLVISDVEMPRVNGDTMCLHLQQIGVEDRPVVLLMTGLDNFKMQYNNFLKAGANQVLRKPFDINDLVAGVRTAIEKNGV